MASNGDKNVCPAGWHVPTDGEWTILTDFLTNNGYGYQGSGNDIGKSMANTSGWTTYATAGKVGNDQASNNTSGFTAISSGFRSYAPFSIIGYFGNWWSTSENFPLNAFARYMNHNNNGVSRNYSNERSGISVRCLQN